MSSPKLKKIGIVNVDFGENVIIVEPSNIYGCKIGNDVFVGPFVEIQRNVKIGSGTRIQSHTFICEMVSIGSNCFVGHGVMFINDTFSEGGPARGNRGLWKPTIIGDNVSIGSNATILPVTICDDAVIGAGAVVTKDIAVSGVYAGNPAKKIK